MDTNRFNSFSLSVARLSSRRKVSRLVLSQPALAGVLLELGAGSASIRAEDDDHGSSHPRHRRSTRHKHRKNTVRRNKKHKKYKPNPPNPPCARRGFPANFCGSVADGRGGTLTCDCGPDQLCIESVCRVCHVTCAPGNAVACGNTLQDALDDPGLATLAVCPGIYQGNFTIARTVAVIGAGQGEDADVSTILDANNAGRVLLIGRARGTVELTHLRLRNGSSLVAGAGIYVQGTTLRLRDSTVMGNTSTNNDGGGIAVLDAEGPSPTAVLEAERCTISHNRAPNYRRPRRLRLRWRHPRGRAGDADRLPGGGQRGGRLLVVTVVYPKTR